MLRVGWDFSPPAYGLTLSRVSGVGPPAPCTDDGGEMHLLCVAGRCGSDVGRDGNVRRAGCWPEARLTLKRGSRCVLGRAKTCMGRAGYRLLVGAGTILTAGKVGPSPGEADAAGAPSCEHRRLGRSRPTSSASRPSRNVRLAR